MSLLLVNIIQAIGEPPLFLSASIFFAIKNAIYSAREDAGITGYFRLDAPATVEKIRLACQDDITKKVRFCVVRINALRISKVSYYFNYSLQNNNFLKQLEIDESTRAEVTDLWNITV